MKIVITGATSFIGIELTEYLLSNGHSVIAVCRPNSKGLSSIPNGVEIVSSEMADYGNLHNEIAQADVFINLAWGGTGHDGRNVVDVQKENIAYTTAAFFAADKMGCKLFIEAGSQAEYGSTTKPQSEDSPCNPFSEYGKAKLQVKEELFNLSEQMDMKYIHLRIFSMFGENDHPWTLVMSAIDKMLRNEQVDLSPCTQNWNFIYIKDAVRIISTLCEKSVEKPYFKHEVYNIASEDTRVLKDFVVRMKELTNSTGELNFGAMIPANLVSLQPNMSKTKSVVETISSYSFDDVITKIIETKTV